MMNKNAFCAKSIIIIIDTYIDYEIGVRCCAVIQSIRPADKKFSQHFTQLSSLQFQWNSNFTHSLHAEFVFLKFLGIFNFTL